MSAPINDKLSELHIKGRIPFHMPGHKRKTIKRPELLPCIKGAEEVDITEISGYDNLHHPEGMIRESMDQLRKIYQSRESWYLVNGSTVGILAAISAVCQPGDKILVARNCHKAVYNAIMLRQLKAVYLYPAVNEQYGLMLDVGQAEKEKLAEIIREEKDIRAVVLTSPTYEGVISDIAGIREILSAFDDRIPLIVDEAHGAHLHFHDAFPDSAVSCGADIVIQSVHKTLPALTQTGLLHLCSDRVSADDIYEWLSVYETSSPSYILMASAEAAVIFMHFQWKKLQNYVDNLYEFRNNCGKLLHIHLINSDELPVFAYDPGKLLFAVPGQVSGGRWLLDRLGSEWNIELEMAAKSYAVAMTSVMDEEEDYRKLWEALQALDFELHEQAVQSATDIISPEQAGQGSNKQAVQKPSSVPPFHWHLPAAVKVHESWEGPGSRTEKGGRRGKCLIPLRESAGQVSASYVMLYPPGIPLLVPGEKIMKEMVENLFFYLYNGYNVQGLYTGGTDERYIYCDGGTGRVR